MEPRKCLYYRVTFLTQPAVRFIANILVSLPHLIHCKALEWLQQMQNKTKLYNLLQAEELASPLVHLIGEICLNPVKAPGPLKHHCCYKCYVLCGQGGGEFVKQAADGLKSVVWLKKSKPRMSFNFTARKLKFTLCREPSTRCRQVPLMSLV